MMILSIGENLNKKTSRGFTLIEILLVVVLISVISAIAVPNFSQPYKNLQLKTATNDIAYLMRYAQSRAVSKNKKVRIEFSDGRQRYWLTEESQKGVGVATEEQFVKISSRLGRENNLGKDIRVEMQEENLIFYPDGTMDKRELSVCNLKKCFLISTKVQRGYVSVFEEES